MKPNFALNLSHEGISLLHRAKAGWMAVGDVQLDAPDLNQQLSILRKTAANLDQAGLASKLIIPSSQILYTELDAPGPSKKARLDQIRKGLVGLTPYDVDDLVFDWRIDGPKVQVAVVARETLKEAESFAADFRFNPVSFVGNTSPANFDGEPFFGPTAGADVILEQGDAVEPDGVAMKIVARSKAKPAPPVAESAIDETIDAPTVPPQPPKKKPTAAKKPKAKAPAAAADPGVALPDSMQDLASSPANEPVLGGQAEQGEQGKDVDDTDRNLAPDTDPPAPAPLSFASRRAASANLDATATPSSESREQVARYSALDLDDVPDMPAWRATPRQDTEQPPLSVTSAQTADPQPSTPPAPKSKFALTGKTVSNALRPTDRKAAIAASSKEAKAMTVFGARAKPAKIGGKPRYLGLMLTVLLLLAFAVAALWSSLFLGNSNDGETTPEIASIESTSPTTPTIETGPSLGSTSPEIRAPGTETTGITTPGITTPGADTNPLSNAIDNAVASALTGEPTSETAITGTDSAAPLTPTPETALLAQPGATDLNTAPPPDRIVQPPPSTAEAERRYAITGIWEQDPTPLADPTATAPLERLSFASIDPALNPNAPNGLLNASPDQRPLTLAPPRKLRITFDLDERGLIRATPEGALSPEGTLVYLGLPPLVPGVRPGTEIPDPDLGVVAPPAPETDITPEVLVPEVSETPEQPETVEAPETVEPETVPETVEVPETPAVEITPDPPALTPEQELLREFRPQPRPSSIEETFNQAPNGEGFTLTELASIRPTVRPPSIQEEVAADEPDLEPTPETTDDNSETTETAEADAGTALAINASALPRGRPAAVERAAAKFLEQRRNDPPPAREREVEVAAVVTPSIPSRASVARAATETNAINLSKVNLIGVYGSSSDRRALVRLKNGRYVKVEIGDNVDGGRVAAISANELRYVKRGKTIALKMPKG